MEAQRDHFDQKYETSRFEASLELPGASVGEARDFMEMQKQHNQENWEQIKVKQEFLKRQREVLEQK